MTTPNIHPTVIIESGAKIDDSVKIGPYSIIGKMLLSIQEQKLDLMW